MADLGRSLPAFDNRTPLLFFRIGYADPPSARSLRKELNEMFEERT